MVSEHRSKVVHSTFGRLNHIESGASPILIQKGSHSMLSSNIWFVNIQRLITTIKYFLNTPTYPAGSSCDSLDSRKQCARAFANVGVKHLTQYVHHAHDIVG